MNKLIWICVGVAAVVIVRDQRERRFERVTPDGAAERERSRSRGLFGSGGWAESNGFVEIGREKDQPRDTVLVIAALNCPSDGSKRAEALAQALREQGIPVLRRNGFALDVASLGAVQLAAASQRLQRLFDGPTPAVFINTMGCANPSLEQVLAEYRAQTGR